MLETLSLSKEQSWWVSIPAEVQGFSKWAQMDLNHRPHPYQGCALTELSYGPSGRAYYPSLRAFEKAAASCSGRAR